jgi:hypothetical protein
MQCAFITLPGVQNISDSFLISLQNVHQDLIWLLTAGAKKSFKWVHFEAVYLLESCRVLGQLHFSWVLWENFHVFFYEKGTMAESDFVILYSLLCHVVTTGLRTKWNRKEFVCVRRTWRKKISPLGQIKKYSSSLYFNSVHKGFWKV